MNIIDDRVRELVKSIERATTRTPAVDANVRALVQHLNIRCAHADVVARYASYQECQGELEALPTDSEGYVISYDPLTQEAQFRECWRKSGIVVSKNVVSPAVRQRAIDKMHELTLDVSEGRCDLAKPETWAAHPLDSGETPLFSRGFFELYHDDSIAALRQSVRVYIHYVLIWGRADIWATYDRLGIKLPGHEESGGLPLHVDQNPNVHPSFRTVQGVLALVDCPAERGTYVGVPGSRKLFMEYSRMAKNAGEYVELDPGEAVASTFEANRQACPLRGGDLISWDSRTTHANSENVSDKTRYVAYIAAGPAREHDPNAVEARKNGFQSGIGSNVRDAMMHASKPPRYTNPEALARIREPERLSLLGELLYGFERYDDLVAAPSAER